MTDIAAQRRGIHRRDTQAEHALKTISRKFRRHGMMANTIGLVLAALSMAPQLPGAAIIISTALLFLMPVGGGVRGPRVYAALWLGVLGLGWGALAAAAMHTNPPLIAIACMVGAWLAMLPSLIHVATASAVWTLLCMGPPVAVSLWAYQDVAGVGAALILIAAAGHMLTSMLRDNARQMGGLEYDKSELDGATLWLQGRIVELQAENESSKKDS
jgi:hypothetical protein